MLPAQKTIKLSSSFYILLHSYVFLYLVDWFF